MRIEYFDDQGKTAVGVFRDGMMIGASGVPLYPKDALALDEDMPFVVASSPRPSAVPPT
jgi:hypothetical protein